MKAGKLLKLLPYLGMIGVKPKEIVTYFNSLFRDFIIQQHQEVSTPGNMVSVMTMVNHESDLIFIPVELGKDENENFTKIVSEGNPVNTSKLIRETDINEAFKMLADENIQIGFFEVLEKCKA